jgi:phospholipase/carboxylesterase
MKTEFKHIFIPGDIGLPALLLLHGTGGDEQDLVELGKFVSPASPLLSVRGKVLENGMPRFFRRLSEGIFDLEDLKFRTNELADFVAVCRHEYGLANASVYALGYSNGANIAANMLLERPESLQGAILLRAMVTSDPAILPDLKDKQVLMLSGLMDQIIPPDNSKNLAAMLKTSGAKIDIRMKPTGHALTQSDFSDIKNWIETEIL